MTRAAELVSDALRSLNDWVIAESLCGTARALVGFCENAQQCALHTALEREGLVRSGRVDGWSLPDAVWMGICRRRPHLNRYPLGEIAERAVKKVIVSLALPRTGPGKRRVGPNQDPGELLENVRCSLLELGREGLLQLLLRHYLFEICIDNLRRPADDPESDLSSKYHLSAAGDRLISLDVERRRRQSLGGQCEALAEKFLPFLLKGIEQEREPAEARQLVANGLAEVLGAPLPKGRKERDLDRPFVNVVVGTRSPATIRESFTLGARANRLLLHAERANVSASFDPLERWLGRSLHPLVKDLVDIGVAVYMSDLYTRRERHLGRRMGLLLPVRHLKLWSGARAEVERTVASLGRDDFHLHFVKRKERTKRVEFHLKDDERCVCLFSGGLDSMAGAVWALDSGLMPVFVSHYANNRLGGIQHSLLSQLGEAYEGEVATFRITEESLQDLRSEGLPDDDLKKLQGMQDQGFMGTGGFLDALRETIGKEQVDRYGSVLLKHARGLQHVSLYAARSRSRRARYPLSSPQPSIMAQHLRSFLFMSLAAAVALESGIGRVYIFENGPVALNPLFSEARVNTRTAHPRFLACFRAFVTAVFGVDLRIENPFAYLTKGEVVGILARPELHSLVAQTTSCWNWFQVPLLARRMGVEWRQESHDGECLPCILRRTAMHRAGLWEKDARYLTDVFNAYPDLSRDTVVALADFLSFCRSVISLSDAELLLRAPDLCVYDQDTDPRRLVEMYREHAAEVIHCFRARSNAEFREDFAPLLAG